MAALLSSSNGCTFTGIEGISTGIVLIGSFTSADQSATKDTYTMCGGSIVVNWGDGSPPQQLGAGNLTQRGMENSIVWEISAPHTYAEEGVYAVTINVTAADGGFTVISSSAIIDDANLSPLSSMPYIGNTGIEVSFSDSFVDTNINGTISDFSGVIDWGDGSPISLGTITQPEGVGTQFIISGIHTYAKPNVYNVKVNVVDVGGSIITFSSGMTITDLPVVIGATNNFTITEGINTCTYILATYTDPNTLATISNEFATLTIGGWGDGTPQITGEILGVRQIGTTPLTLANPGAPIFEVFGNHTYKKATPAGLPNTLSIIITTLGGTTTTLTSPPGGGVTVLDAPLSSYNGTIITGTEGNDTGFVFIGAFTDANQYATSTDYTSGNGSITVSWGDGSSQTLMGSNLVQLGVPNGVTWKIFASHIYVDAGIYSIIITVQDDDGSATVISSSASITGAPLTALAKQPHIHARQNALFNNCIGSFTDGNPNGLINDFNVTINWGDGSSLIPGVVKQYGVGTTFYVKGLHSYKCEGHYDIQIFVVNVSGSQLIINNKAYISKYCYN